MDRYKLIKNDVKMNDRILEFSPYYRPLLPKSEGYDVDIVDVCDRKTLIERAKRDPYIEDYSMIEEVDYVCSSNYVETIGKRKEYDYVVASHVIEHTTDIIQFLSDCTDILKDDGIIKLFIPDKRYTFDFFREVTSTRIAIDKHMSLEKVHSLGTVVEHDLRYCVTDVSRTDVPNSAFFYIDDLLLLNSNSNSMINKIRENISNFSDEKYIDVHSWIVTPKSFETMIYELNMLGFLNIYVDKILTENNSVEFYVELKKGKVDEDDLDKRIQLYVERKREDIEEFEDVIEIEKLKKYLYSNPNSRVYIFGTGNGSLRIKRILRYLMKDYCGYIVSDGKRIDKSINGKPVFELSEIYSSEGVVVLVGTAIYRSEVLPELLKRGLKCFF